MPARSIDDQIARLETLKHAPLSPETIAELHKALSHKSNFLVAKAANIVAAQKIKSLADALAEAFHRLLGDKGCVAATAIVKALIALEIEDETVFLKASRHVQMEPTWGGSQDVAVELRCESVAAL